MGLTQLGRRRAMTRLGARVRRDGTCYRVRRWAATSLGDFWIETHEGRHVYRIGVAGMPGVLEMEDAHGDQQCLISDRGLPVRRTIHIELPNGPGLAVVEGGAGAPGDAPWTVELVDGRRLLVLGSVVDHEYTVVSGRRRLAAVSTRWFRDADSSGVLIPLDEDPVLALAVGVALDSAARPVRPSAVISRG